MRKQNSRPYQIYEKILRKLMTKAQLAKKTGVPLAVIKDLIADGFLQVIKFPKSRGEKYSPTQLADLIRQYNKLPWAGHPICKLSTHHINSKIHA